MAKFTKLSFCQKLIFWHKTSSCKCSMCLYYVGKVSDSFSKSSDTSWFPCACTIWALTKPLLRSKVTGEIWPEFELVWDFILILFICKFDEDPIQNDGANMETPVSHLSLWEFCFVSQGWYRISPCIIHTFFNPISVLKDWCCNAEEHIISNFFSSSNQPAKPNYKWQSVSIIHYTSNGEKYSYF